MSFRLSSAYLDPFDTVYSAVTKRLKERATTLSAADNMWLCRLMETFLDERKRWNDTKELEQYRARWLQLRTRILRLVAGAYLHVSYDLPRAIADDWPGRGRWVHGPDEFKGQAVFQSIKDVFTDSLRANAKRRSVVGYAFFLGFLPRGMLAWIGIWLLHLRRAAWDHARILANQPNRQQREAAMAAAIALALQEASDFTPWNTSLLDPPDDALRSPTAASLVAIVSVIGEYAWAIALIMLSILLLLQYRLTRRLSWDHEAAFVRRFALLIEAYVGFAVHDPEGFSAYLRTRGSGISPFDQERSPPDGERS
jgi:hypothetical protein